MFLCSTCIQHHHYHINTSSMDVFHWTLTSPPPTHPNPPVCNLVLHVKTEGSWKLRGTPSLEPIYIYKYINIYIYYTHTVYRDVTENITKASRRPGLSIGISEAKRSKASLGGVGGRRLWFGRVLGRWGRSLPGESSKKRGATSLVFEGWKRSPILDTFCCFLTFF